MSIIQGRYDSYKPDVQKMRFKAFLEPWDGKKDILLRYRQIFKSLTDSESFTSIIITFDVGYHNSGWWKNSQYDRCLHLSISMNDGKNVSKSTEEEINAWIDLVFKDTHPDAMKWLWHETGFKHKTVDHYRLFYSKITNQPILPQGQVYDLVPYQDGSSPEKIFNRCGM